MALCRKIAIFAICKDNHLKRIIYNYGKKENPVQSRLSGHVAVFW